MYLPFTSSESAQRTPRFSLRSILRRSPQRQRPGWLMAGFRGLCTLLLLGLTSPGAWAQCSGDRVLTSQAQVNAFPAGCTVYTGSIQIEGNDITDISPLANLQRITGRLVILRNPSLASIAGLSSLSSVAGEVRIQDNPQLTGLAGLEKLASIGGQLVIFSNNQLASIAGLSSLSSVAGELRIQSHLQLTSLAGLEKLTSIGGRLLILGNNQLASIAGLSSLSSVAGEVVIELNDQLTSLTGLEKLASIGGQLVIFRNNQLASIAGLSSLSSVAGEVRIQSHLQLTSLAGLEKLTSIGGRLAIFSNNQLASIAGLSSLSSVAGELLIESNPQLTSLAGLEKLTSIGGRLAILNNAQLTTCAIASVCRFIATPPPGGVTISGNATGCASVPQVQANCNLLTITGFAASPDVVCVGSPVTFTATVANATTPYAFTITNGVGTSIATTSSTTAFSQSLVASGSGSQSFTLTVSSGEQTATATTTLTVNPAPVVNNPSVTTATQGQPFSQPFTASGGSSPYSFSLASGTLPPGLSLTMGGVLSGTTTQTGSFSLSVQATDANGCVGVGSPYTLTVNPAQAPCPTGDVTLSSQAQVNAFPAGCPTLSGTLLISGADITDLSPLASITGVGRALQIQSNPVLTSLTGLEKLSSIGGGLAINSNAQLPSLAALSSLSSVAGQVQIQSNPVLTSLTGLEKLSSIGGGLAIESNAGLTTCAIASVCRFLATPPPGGITISGNATGCASVAQVQALCNGLAITGFVASPDVVCVGSPVTFTATATNAALPYAFTLTNGSIGTPTGTTTGSASSTAFSQSVVASGSGSQSFTLTISSGGQTATATTSITVNPAPVVSNPSVTTATQGQPFSQTFTASGGSSPYSFSLTSGSLPNGLSLSTGGVLSGTPTQTGSFSLSVQVTDANGCAGVGNPYTLTVNAAQAPCPTGNVTLSSQADVNAFPAGCPTIPGNLIISGADITDLSPLANLQRITDNDLIIQNNPQLTSLTGLGSLTAVARGNVRIQGNPELTSLTGLEKLSQIGRTLFIINNAKITSLASLSSVNSIGSGVEIESNSELTSLTGLGRLGEIRNGDLSIRNNPKLISLAGLSRLSLVGGRLFISDNRDLTSLTGLDNLSEIGTVEFPVGMFISNNPSLTSIAALSRVRIIGGEVVIEGNGELTSLNGLERLTKIGDRSDGFKLEINGNAKLASLAGLSSLTLVGRDVVIQGNRALTSLSGLENLTRIGRRLAILNNAQLTTCAIASVCRFIATPPPGGITISGNATGCASVAEVQANCNPANNAPSFTKGADQTVEEDAGPQTITAWATNISPGATNESDQTLTFIVSNNNNSLFSAQPAIAPNGTLTYAPAADANGLATVRVKLRDNGGTADGGVDESAEQTFTITVNPVDEPPTNGVFSITGVTTISCEVLSAGQRRVTFNPRYAGLDGSPVSFSVVNEMLPTTAPGPYVLNLFTDNPVITLSATQSGANTLFAYNWLSACSSSTGNTPPTVANPVPPQSATVGIGYTLSLANVFTDAETPNGLVLSVTGLPAGLNFVAPSTISGTPSMSGVSSVTVTATDPGSLSASTSFTLTVRPAAGTPPPPTGTFSITSVQTISCQVLSAGQRRLTFNPQYAGLNGAPVSFSVVNELAPTTNPGPYTLDLFTDNPVITLSAVQSGVSSSFAYNWLAVCSGTTANTPPTVANPVAPQSATVGVGYTLSLANVFTDAETPNQLPLSVTGLPAGLNFVAPSTISGTPSMSGVSTVTLTATDPGSMSSSTSFTITVNPGAGDTPPPTGPFSITGVQTISCEVLSAGQRRVTFNPQYAGLDSSPVSFSVANELTPTTAPGPYTLTLFTDNPVISLRAVQSGVSSSFSYGWLSACNPGARLGVSSEVPLTVAVLGNPAREDQVWVEVQGEQDQAVALRVYDQLGHEVSTTQGVLTRGAGLFQVKLGQDGGIYHLNVRTASQQQTVRIIKH